MGGNQCPVIEEMALERLSDGQIQSKILITGN